MTPTKGDIPQAMKFKYARTCFDKHFGLCESQDAALLPQLKKLSTSIRQHAEEANWYALWTLQDEKERDLMYAFCAFVRNRGPALSIFAPAVASEGGEGRNHTLLAGPGRRPLAVGVAGAHVEALHATS